MGKITVGWEVGSVEKNYRDEMGWERMKNVQLHENKTVVVELHDRARRWI